MREYDNRKSIPSKVGWIFFVLWLLSKISNVLGRYEYQKEFLLLAFALWTVGAFVDGILKKGSAVQKIRMGLRKSGSTLFGLWILVLILDLLDFIDPWWNLSKHYLIAASLILLCISFILHALEKRNNLWHVRSALYSLGSLVLFVWIISKLFGFFESDQDTIIICGIILIAVGYVIGVSRHAHGYFLTEDNISMLRDEMDEIPKRKIMDVKILKENANIEHKAHVTFEKGDVFVQINEGSMPYAFVFFGKGSYTLKTPLQTFKDDFMGFSSVKGTEILTSTPTFVSEIASESDCNKLGLTMADIKELALLTLSDNEGNVDTLDDLLVNVRKDGTDINLKFIKIHEGSEGDYVKVGPIEVADMHNKKTRIRIGDMEFGEKGTIQKEMTPVGIAYRILTTDGTINLTSTNDIATLHSDSRSIEVKGKDLSIIDKRKEYLYTSRKTKIVCPSFEISLRNDKRATIKSEDFKLSIREGIVTADHGGHHVDVTDNTVAEEILDIIKKRCNRISVDMFNDDISSYGKLVNELVTKLELHE